MNNAFTKHFKSVAAVVAAAVMSVSLSASVFADTLEKAELKANADRADVILTLPRAAAEGVSSVQVSLNITVNTDNAEITFVPNEKLGAKIQESRYHKDEGVLNIYAAGTSPLFDKADPTVTLGYVVITSNAPKGATANVAFAKDSLKYVRSSTLETYDNGLSYSDTVQIKVGAGGEKDPPVIPPNPDNPEKPGEEEPSKPQDPPVVNPPVEGDQPQPSDLTILKTVLATAESYKAEDYTAESFKALQTAIAQAKEVINNVSPAAEQIEEARMALENAIGALVKKAEQLTGDGSGSGSGSGSNQNGGGNSQNGENNSSSNNGEGSSNGNNNGNNDGNDDNLLGNDDDNSKNPANGDTNSEKDGFDPLIVILIATGVIVVGLGVAIAITLNKGKTEGKHSK